VAEEGMGDMSSFAMLATFWRERADFNSESGLWVSAMGGTIGCNRCPIIARAGGGKEGLGNNHEISPMPGERHRLPWKAALGAVGTGDTT